jgi:SOS-response transcriptional repressor LexA
MNSSGILKGDLVLVEKRSIANSEKNLLVCVSDDEDFIVRSFAFANNRIQLLPSNRTYLTKEIKPTDKNSNTIIFGEVRLTIRKTKK